MEKENWFLPTYQIKESIALDDEDKEIIKEMVLERCEKWKDNYIDNFRENYGDDSNYRRNDDLLVKDAIDNAKLALESNFGEVQEDYELIQAESDSEDYSFQESIIKQWINSL